MKNLRKNNNAITLIALVITIIILLILAGVTIATLIENGLLNKAKQVGQQTRYTNSKEMVLIKIMEINSDCIANGKKCTIEEIYYGMEKAENITINKIFTSETAKVKDNIEMSDILYLNDISVSVDIYSEYNFLISLDGNTERVLEGNVEEVVSEEEFTHIEEFEKDKFGKKIESEEKEEIQNYEYITSENYGDYINYAIDLNDDGNLSNDWKIFYKSESNIYIIADNYVKTSNETYKMVLPNLSNYTGAVSINSEVSDRFYLNIKNSYPNLATNNIKATAYLMDQNIWKDYASAKGGEYAISSPTLELFIKSWNEKFKDNSGYYQIIFQIKSNGYAAGRYGSSVGTRPYISKSRI